MDSLAEFEESLKSQLESLAKEIRSSEMTLTSLKEGYLKVQGALEILSILKQKQSAQDDTESVFAALE
jgi:hypothetical protein